MSVSSMLLICLEQDLANAPVDLLSLFCEIGSPACLFLYEAAKLQLM